jgi:hypothetical protein
MTEFHDAMTAAGVKALWEQQDRHHFPPEPAHLWPWRSINPLIDAAIAAWRCAIIEPNLPLGDGSPRGLADGRGRAGESAVGAAVTASSRPAAARGELRTSSRFSA